MAYEHIEGAEELQRRLLQLAPNIERNVMRGALRAGANVFVRIGQAEAPRRTGKLAASIRVSTRTRRGLVMAQAKVGDGKAFYAHMIHGGTKPHNIPKRGTRADRARRRGLYFGGIWVRRVRHPGIKANPFMLRAFHRGGSQAIEAIAAYIRKRLDKLEQSEP